uniref:Uncharacterized protein n=1 Tax=Amphimedon queenslandica TaxID=400682 RepID=A0A1X7V586_AMPQE
TTDTRRGAKASTQKSSFGTILLILGGVKAGTQRSSFETSLTYLFSFVIV